MCKKVLVYNRRKQRYIQSKPKIDCKVNLVKGRTNKLTRFMFLVQHLGWVLRTASFSYSNAAKTLLVMIQT